MILLLSSKVVQFEMEGLSPSVVQCLLLQLVVALVLASIWKQTVTKNLGNPTSK